VPTRVHLPRSILSWPPKQPELSQRRRERPRSVPRQLAPHEHAPLPVNCCELHCSTGTLSADAVALGSAQSPRGAGIVATRDADGALIWVPLPE
jgi:hypothetical protein